MRYNDPTLRQLLAGQYALGALHGAVRRRFEQLMRGDAALRGLVQDWQNELAPLAAETRPVDPPARVFAAIQRRLDQGRAAAPAHWWQRLGFWRTFSAAMTVAVVALAIGTALLVQRPALIAAPGYIAVLEDKTAKPVLVIRAYTKPWRLVAEPVGLPSPPAGKVFYVWAIEKGTGAVRGLVAVASDKPQVIPLHEEYWKIIKNADSLLVSIEDTGTEPAAPTSPALFSGACINLKGV